MKWYINTSNYYLSTTVTIIDATSTEWSFEIADISVEWVTLPLKWFYWVDVDFSDTDKREIFRIVKREWYTLYYDKRISPNDKHQHSAWASVGLRDFSEIFNSLSANTDNFWQVEVLDWFKIKVYWGKSLVSWEWVKDIEDVTYTLEPNHTYYIEFNTDTGEFWLVDEFNPDNYSVAKIITLAEDISTIEDYRAAMVSGWLDNMKAEVYDPDGIKADAFDMENMKQWTEKQYVTPEEVERWDNKQDELVSGQNIKTINWHRLLWEWDIELKTILTVGWVQESIPAWASSYVLTNDPYSSTSLMVIYDSWTVALAGVDYTFDYETKTITFTTPLESNESAYVWVMVQTWSQQERVIGDWQIKFKANEKLAWMITMNQTSDKTIVIPIWEWKLTLKRWDTVVEEFSANDNRDIEVDLESDLWRWNISIKQWRVVKWEFNVNQNDDEEISLENWIFVTEDEYELLPDDKLSDNNTYIFYHVE